MISEQTGISLRRSLSLALQLAVPLAVCSISIAVLAVRERKGPPAAKQRARWTSARRIRMRRRRWCSKSAVCSSCCFAFPKRKTLLQTSRSACKLFCSLIRGHCLPRCLQSAPFIFSTWPSSLIRERLQTIDFFVNDSRCMQKVGKISASARTERSSVFLLIASMRSQLGYRSSGFTAWTNRRSNQATGST